MEKNYLQADKALAVVSECSSHFYVYIYEAHIHVVIDHKALILLFGNPKIKYQRWRDRAGVVSLPKTVSLYVICLDDCCTMQQVKPFIAEKYASRFVLGTKPEPDLESAPKPVKSVQVFPLIPMESNFKDDLSYNEDSEIRSGGVINESQICTEEVHVVITVRQKTV